MIFPFRREWYESVRDLDERTRLDVYDGIMDILFGNGNRSVSPLASGIIGVIRLQIEKDIEKNRVISEKRSLAGRKHRGNQFSSNGTKWNKTEQNGTNGTSVPFVPIQQPLELESVAVENGTNGTNVPNIKDASVKEKEREIEDFIDRMYKLYPTRCPVRNTSLGKCYKDKERIRKLLRDYSMEQIEQVIQRVVDEKYGKHYMQNFSTFLNNFPDPNSLFNVEQSVSEEKKPSEGQIIDGILYR